MQEHSLHGALVSGYERYIVHLFVTVPYVFQICFNHKLCKNRVALFKFGIE